MEKQFYGKVAFITGGARGIGKGIADVLADRGANLAISDIDDAELKVIEKEFQQKNVDIIVGKDNYQL